nr:hypothetical protein [Ktedonobacter sp. SOSP1-52]
MPKRKGVQREHTEDWQTIQQYILCPEQTAYELLRPVVFFGDPAIQRAQETDEPRTSLERKADAFDEQGMVSFFASRPREQPQETARSLSPDMRQLIVDLRVEMLNMSICEIAEICDTRFQGGPRIIRSRLCWHLARLHQSRCAASLPGTPPLIRRTVVTTLCSFMRKDGLLPPSPSICR